MSEPLWVFTWEHLDTLQPGLLICLFCRLRLGGK